MKREVKKEVPVLVKIIAVLTTIIGIAYISFELFFISILSLGIFLSYSLILLIGLIIFSVFLIKGLFNGKKWARIAEIMFLSLLVIGYIISSIIIVMSANSVSIATNSNIPPVTTLVFIYSKMPIVIIFGLIIGYLLFNKKVKKAFS